MSTINGTNNGDGTWTYYLADNRSEQLAVDARLRGEFYTGPIRHEMLVGVQRLKPHVAPRKPLAHWQGRWCPIGHRGADGAGLVHAISRPAG